MKTLMPLVVLVGALSFQTTAQQQRKEDPCKKANQTGVTVDLVKL